MFLLAPACGGDVRVLADLARGVSQLLLPNACPVCDAPEGGRADFRHGLCNECRRAVAHDPHDTCSRCAATVGPHADTTDGCLACRSWSPKVDSAVRLGVYEGRLRDAILRMKFAAGEGLAETMGRVFWEAACPRLRVFSIGVVVPVPLHWRRRWSRGHNQAEDVARELAVGLGVPLAPRALRRVRHTPQQAQPSASARRENVKGAFRAISPASVADRTVLLVDDVMTTGSTAAEAAGTLYKAGADRVVVAVLARR